MHNGLTNGKTHMYEIQIQVDTDTIVISLYKVG